MPELILLLSLLIVLTAAGYVIYRAFSPPAQPSWFEGETSKKHLALLFAASSALLLTDYLTDREDTLALFLGLAGAGAAVHTYLRPATGALPDSARFRQYRLTALVTVAGIAMISLTAARPQWSHQILWFWAVGAVIMLAWGLARELLRRRP